VSTVRVWWWPVIVLALAATGEAFADTSSGVLCARLDNMTVDASLIGLPTRGAKLTKVAHVDVPDLCVLQGEIKPVDPDAPGISFRINLPRNWNGNAVQVGGGGFDGVLVDGQQIFGVPADADPVRKGYATFGSDGGHQSEGGFPEATLDGAFALNVEALENFAGAQLKKVHDVASVAIKRYYGWPTSHVYFYGTSQGGHEALYVAQRYPLDYDGVVSLYPAYNFIAIVLSDVGNAQHLYRSPVAWISPEKAKLIGRSVLARCDGLDGLEDGIVSNVAACRAAFNVHTLQCPESHDLSADCLSDAEIRTALFISQRQRFPFEVNGTREFSGFHRSAVQPLW
jgi:Tannase and feruloyl esterase